MWVRKSTSGFPVYGTFMFFIMSRLAALNSLVDCESCGAGMVLCAVAPAVELVRAMMRTNLAIDFMMFSFESGFEGSRKSLDDMITAGGAN
jgi:hypothetical protein